MPMEQFRRRFAEDPNMYPELGGPRKVVDRSQVISIASTSSDRSTVAPVNRGNTHKSQTIVVSSDEEGGLEVGNSNKPHRSQFPERSGPSSQVPLPRSFQNGVPQPQRPLVPASNTLPSRPVGIPIPANLYRPQIPKPTPAPVFLKDGEEIIVPEFQDEFTYLTPGETEKALRDLMGGGMNEDIDIDMDEAIVEGFKEGVALLPHQIIGRSWMRDREDMTKKRTGGILADDMGLGKTIQTLSRITEGRPRRSDREDGWSGSTLVVCPLALVGQWASEIEKMTKLRVVKHQGQSRTTDPTVLQKYNVVVTTYDTVKSEYDAYSPPAKDESSSKKKSKKASPVGSSDDDSEGEDFGRTLAKKKPGKAPVKRCALYGIKWWRVVLDEAHNIKNVKTKGATACCELQSKFRWCLTGTPMQNNVMELYSLIKFLRIKPLSNLDTFNEQIGKPMTSGRGAGRAMKRLQVILKQIMLRRKKDDVINGKKLIELPKRTVNVISCPFDHSEKSFYDALESKMESVLDKLMSQTKGGSAYISVLLLLLRLRQACNHPLLVSKDYKNDADAVEPAAVKGKDDKDVDGDDLVAAFGQLGVTRKCQVCTIPLDGSNAGEGEWKTHCLDCISLAKRAKEAEEERPTSAKVRMILKLLGEIDKRSESEEKTIIFSQFTTMLNLIEPFLEEEGIKFVRYDGSMTPKEREASLEKIKSSSSTRVILISFKAGSTGLNLTACNNVILVDLWWNPALEDQAFDRAHRFGQTRDVNIFKLKIDNTVEDRILLLQEKKRALAQAALSGDKIKNMRLGMDDLLALFRPGGRDEDEEED